LLLVALALAACTAFAEEPPGEPQGPPRARDTEASPATAPAPPSDAGGTDVAPGDVVGAAEGASPASAPPDHLSSGRAPLAGDAPVPVRWLPPGASEQDRGPSEAIFPPQRLTLRFNHKLHAVGQRLPCARCHAAATTSHTVADKLTPDGATCDACHGTSHADRSAVTAGDDPSGQCGYCHLGYQEGAKNRVARFELPRANLVFDHQKHAARNIGCQQCHGEVQELELATRDQLPRMRGCVGCHQHPDAAARGEAKGACETCHLRGGAADGGRIRTTFPSGTLRPPRWLHNAEHTADFVERHKYVAANDSQLCASCHKEEFCAACHDGRVRPRNVHPSDYLSMHAVEGRLATQRCTSCHREQSFCLGCHQRLGVSMSGPGREAGRFHPPKSLWSDAPRRPGHHAFEANRNLAACVSCHIERDCVVCHGGQGIGGGFSPHPGGFTSGCATQLRRNPRPCYVCHEPGASALARCK
jgi:hypothetical protein